MIKQRCETFQNFIDNAIIENQYFYMKTVQGPQEARTVVNDKEMIMLCSNNYLGLSTHPRVKEAAIKAIERYGTGVSGSRLINGNNELNEMLEQKLANFKKTESAILFSNGYLTNLGIISTLLQNTDVAISDKLNHASIIDGCKMSNAIFRQFNHNNMNKLEEILRDTQDEQGKMIVTEGVFSMDGDIGDIPSIVNLAKKHNAIVMVDEAHATGVLGENGRGAVEHFKQEGKVDIIMGTLSKSLGGVGGFIAASKEIINYLRHNSRQFIFTAALPPSVIASVSAAIDIIQEEPKLRFKLWRNVNNLREGLKELGFNTGISNTQIIPVIIGDQDKTIKFTQMLHEDGIFVIGILFPAVAKNKSRLRSHVMATHSDDDIEIILKSFKKNGKALGII